MLGVVCSTLSYARVLPDNVNFSQNDSSLCEVLELQLLKNGNHKNKVDQKKIFIGKSRLKYNRDDYSLWVSNFEHKLGNDLITIDWRGMGGNNFYLAYYIFHNKGGLLTAKNKLKQYLLTNKLSDRHGQGSIPEFARILSLTKQSGEVEEVSFVGFYHIVPMILNDNYYLYAHNKSKNKVFLFSKKNNINTYCQVL